MASPHCRHWAGCWVCPGPQGRSSRPWCRLSRRSFLDFVRRNCQVRGWHCPRHVSPSTSAPAPFRRGAGGPALHSGRAALLPRCRPSGGAPRAVRQCLSTALLAQAAYRQSPGPDFPRYLCPAVLSPVSPAESWSRLAGAIPGECMRGHFCAPAPAGRVHVPLFSRSFLSAPGGPWARILPALPC